MILQFSVSNFRTFRGLQTLNLAANSHDKSLPDNCITTDLPGLKVKRWIKGVALYGANASGKTTVLTALAYLAHLVKNSAKITDPREPILEIDSFALAPEESETPTAFGVTFVAEGVRYEYRVAATRERIWHESLRAFPKVKEQLWFNRDWSPETGSYTWSPERPSGFQRDTQLEGYTLSNMLFLSKAVANNRVDLEPVFRWFNEHLQFLDPSVKNIFGRGFTLNQIGLQSPLHARIVNLLRYADIGVTGARAVEQQFSDESLKRLAANMPTEVWEKYHKERWQLPELVHRAHGEMRVPLPWRLESLGTQALFALAGPWLDILERGLTVCVDELETSLHPHIVRELLRLFFSAKENPKGAQIIFTTHNPLLLDPTLLRRDQVWFTEKDDDGSAHLYPLTDYQPRKGESLARGYLAGRYGAVPFVPSGLLGSFPNFETEGSVEKAAHE